MSQPPASAVRTLRAPKSPLERANAALGPLSNGPANPGPVAARPVVAVAPPKPPADEPQELNIQGPRKLVRPTLPPRGLRDRRLPRREEPVLQWHSGAPTASSSHDSSHAESFYFQKQMQTQTPMVFVLEDGEKIEGCIEWYDRNAIKIRCTPVHSGVYSGPHSAPRPGDGVTRALIYKSSIKYLYKVGENQI
jgi:hypothetical protein